MNRIAEMLTYLAEKTEPAGSWSIEFNDHKSVYETTRQTIEDHEGRGNLMKFQSPAMRQKAIDTDSIYFLQWYNQTPVGFYCFAAPTLEDLAEYVLSSKALED